MRAYLRAVLLWIALIPAAMTSIAVAQNQSQDDVGTVRPNLDGFRLPDLGIVDRLPPAGSGEVITPPQRDTEGPVIRVRDPDFTADSGTATIRVTITDNSGRVDRAILTGPGASVKMRHAGGRDYFRKYRLPSHYRKTPLTVQAWDPSGNRSKPYSVSVRRLPVCGSSRDINVALVQSVQRDLNRLGRYGLGEDGIAGNQTCTAIEAEGIGTRFDWPWLAETLRTRVAIRQISLSIDAPEEITEDIVPIRVNVTDPQQTGVVRRIVMRTPGEADQSQPYAQSVVIFRLNMREGERRRVTFVAQGEAGRRPYAEKSIDLYRLPMLGLELAAAGLIAGKITSDENQVVVHAELNGARSGRIFYQVNGQDDVQSRDYAGVPVAITLNLPQPGVTDELAFQGRSGQRKSDPIFVQLSRIRSIPPDVDGRDLTPMPIPVADPWPPILPVSTVPPQWRPPPVTETTSVTEPKPALPPPLPPAPPAVVTLPPWVFPAAIGVVLIIDLIAGTISMVRNGIRRPDPKPPVVPPVVRVVAVPGPSPQVETLGADLPGLVLTVEPDLQGRVVFEFEETFEGAAQ